jgi:hypothetical protein
MAAPEIAREFATEIRAVLAHAAYAVRGRDMDGMIEGLSCGVTLYEQHPSQVHGPLSHWRDLLVFIRAGRTLCTTLGRPDGDFAALEARAEALRRPLH